MNQRPQELQLDDLEEKVARLEHAAVAALGIKLE